jgi:hypothetical protein
MARLALAAAAAAALAACVPAGGGPVAPAVPVRAALLGVPPPQPLPGTCYARDATPLPRALAPLEEAGDARDDPIWFEIPCAAERDPVLIASLQRALAARGLYSGPVTGGMDDATRAAVEAYQRDFGLRSGVLSLAAARALGLVVWEPEETAAP